MTIRELTGCDFMDPDAQLMFQELLVPLFDEHFSIDGQNAMLGKMMSHVTPDQI